ncbi:MAG: tetratricopeptide repeat protein [Burkholderiales bacterium]
MDSHSVDVNADNFGQVVLEGSKTAPVVIDFWAPWCAPCRALKPVLEKLAAEYAGKFTLAKINSDENPELAANMGVRGIPAVKAVVNGELADEFVGALPESQVRAFIERIVPSPSALATSQARDMMSSGRYADALVELDKALELDPRNEPAQVDRLEVLVKLGRLDEARAAVAGLGPLALDEPRVGALKAELEFATRPEADVASLRQRIAASPGDLDARLELARHHAHAKAFENALQQLIEIVRRDRKFGDDAGRKTMVEIFNLLGSDDPLVVRYRRELSSALY